MGNVPLKRSILFAVLLLSAYCVPIGVAGQQASAYPVIEHLDHRDHLFSQLTDDVSASHRAFARGEPSPPLSFYRYTVGNGEDLLTIAARTNLGAETIATLNGILHPQDVREGMSLILPNVPGIFMAVEARNDLERMVLALRHRQVGDGAPVVVNLPAARQFVFFQDEAFHDIERAYFLGILFRFPLREGSVSSGFGMRTHPITGEECLHSGIDIAAPQGTEVIAARGGRVLERGFNQEGLGFYVILAHEGGYTTLYGHLSTVAVVLNQEVNSGSLLGTVGSTGLSTGPHLHFEVRAGGQLEDPMSLIYGKNR